MGTVKQMIVTLRQHLARCNGFTERPSCCMSGLAGRSAHWGLFSFFHVHRVVNPLSFHLYFLSSMGGEELPPSPPPLPYALLSKSYVS